MPDIDGKEIDLSKIQSDKTLLVFYASWCPHCQELLPQITEFAKTENKNNYQILAISLDTSKTDWYKYIANNKLENFINVSELKGWNSKQAQDYFIYATPTMFLLDKDKKIIEKPTTLEELLIIL